MRAAAAARKPGWYRISPDGVDEVRRAVRTQLRRGADAIKVMAGGGVASPTDQLESSQYQPDELSAAVADAEAAGTATCWRTPRTPDPAIAATPSRHKARELAIKASGRACGRSHHQATGTTWHRGRDGNHRTRKRADLLVVDGDPLADIAVLQHPDNLMAIVKEGQFHKRQI